MAGNSLEYVTKIVHEGNGHLKICSLNEAIDNCRQFLLFRIDILQKTVVPSPTSFYSPRRRELHA